MKYVLAPTQNDILHYGVSHLKSKTGRGSGRYAWGSGKNSSNGVTRQHVKTLNKSSKNRSGADVQISTWKVNIAKNKSGTTSRPKFQTKDNVKAVAKTYGHGHGNCALCTYAMDLRERGIDVQAGDKKIWSASNNSAITDTATIAKWYKTKDGSPVSFADVPSIWARGNPQLNPVYLKTGNDRKRRDAEIKNAMIKGGEGSYGHMSLEWVITDKNDPHYEHAVAGHDTFYKIENGKVMIYDGQAGLIMPYDEYVMVNYNETGKIIAYPKGFLRTDNLEISDINTTDATIEDNTPDKTNYSPSYKTVTKIKSITQYSPPYKSDSKDIIQYSPPYKTPTDYKKITETAVKKVENVSVKTGNSVVNTFKKIVDKFSDFTIDLSNVTSPVDIIRKFKGG